jgi:Mn-dependent DtxR family transcriptional regulator
MLRRLEKLGLVEQKSGVWTTTQQGAILLMFGAAR